MATEVIAIIILAAAFLVFVMPVISLIDVMTKNQFANPSDKIAWVLIILLLPLIGWIVYTAIGKSKTA